MIQANALRKARRLWGPGGAPINGPEIIFPPDLNIGLARSSPVYFFWFMGVDKAIQRHLKMPRKKAINPETEGSMFITSITEANRLLEEWQQIARGVARHCCYRNQGECLIECPGMAICKTEGLTLIQASGEPAFPSQAICRESVGPESAADPVTWRRSLASDP